MAIAELLGRCSFPDGYLHLGVSGGADSVAMAVLARSAGRAFTIWHVDHGIRPSSAADAAFVRDLATEWGVPFEYRRLDLDPSANFEATARRLRYDVLPVDVCVAHTANDRAETVLLNLFRGAGLTGTAARMDRAHRPILSLTRADTVAVCAEAGVVPRHDPTNGDMAMTRNAVRHRLLSEIAEVFEVDPIPLLNRHADLVADALALIETAAAELDPTDVHALRSAPRAVASEALRAWIQQESGDPYRVDTATIERVWQVVEGERRAAETVGGHRVTRSKGRLSFSVTSDHGQART